MLYVALLIGIVLIVSTTKLTEAYKLSSNWELLGHIAAALVIIIVGKLEVSYINQIYGGNIELGYLTIPITLLFLVSFTNVMNIKKVQSSTLLLLSCISLICFSLSAYIIGISFVEIMGICASLIIILILIYGYFSGKMFAGRTLTNSIGFIIAVLSVSLIKMSIVMIYIPIFTLALPLTIYNFIQNKTTSGHSLASSSLIAILFGLLIFIAPSYILWYLIVGFTITLIIMQFSSKYRFI
ncbi:UDP-N-acetylmuramyl pentapeptide phosphotransferase [Lysinibacillus telephonicus]|uniref:UDP-N-acetylmuramyl pentapeptide phosphotransferase n=1 Tax=Lysinibacillus telephonicus TaxID=1714840 RepID=UPI0031FCD68A